jgi:hypothetical protein
MVAEMALYFACQGCYPEEKGVVVLVRRHSLGSYSYCGFSYADFQCAYAG